MEPGCTGTVEVVTDVRLPFSSGMNSGPFWPQAANRPRAITPAASFNLLVAGELGVAGLALATMPGSVTNKVIWHGARAVRECFMSGIGEIMNESEFLALADSIIKSLETQADKWFDELDVDLECERSGNVLTLTFENGSQVVVNSQAPLQEMWVAARSGGFHYRLQNGRWMDTRSGTELGASLSAICSEQSGTPLTVSVP